MKRLLSLSIFLLSLTIPMQAQDDYVAPVEPQVAERLTQWQDLKFGVIFHWGIYAEAGICESWPICSEDWVERDTTYTYESYKRWYWSVADHFCPKNFDASQWAGAVKNAGAKYIIFTTKHHDGFCMYDTKQTDYSIANYGLKGDPRKDAAREVFDAFRKENLWVGAYFSKPDWHSQFFWWDKYATPNRNINYSLSKYPERWEKFKNFTYNQIEELMTGYGDIDILWLDGGQVATGTKQDIDMDRIGSMARKHQDDILIVDRTVGGKWENYCTPERAIPDKPLGYPWESCIPLGDNWGYVPGDPFKSVNTVISNLVEVTAKGGCLLLGVGPSPEGLIPQNVVDSLSLIGNWLKLNGEAIYSTRQAAVTNWEKVWFTAAKEGNTVYAIANEPAKSCKNGEISWKYSLPTPGTKITLLSSGKSVRWRILGDEVIVSVPKGTDLSKPVAFRIQDCHPMYPYQNAKLSPSDRAADLLSRLSLEQKVSLMDFDSPAIPEFGIHKYNWWNEALHGCGRSGLATVFPQAIGMAASWDEALLQKVFDVASTEQRIKYNIARAVDTVGIYTGLSVWTPNINIFRDPRWGRGQETYGEDPYLTSRMGKTVVLGLQGPTDTKYNKLHACLKHYAVHSGPEYARHKFDVNSLPFRDLVETYLYAFKKIIDETDVKQVMCAYNAFEGKPCCSNDKLLTKILREQWGYKNLVVTDCWAVHDNFSSYGHNQYPDNPAGAVAASVRSGADLECGNSFFNLTEAYKQGKITEEEIDKSVFRILKSRFELGEMDEPSTVEWSRIPQSELACDKHHALALKMARETMVLLQNDGVLPLKKAAKVAVVGPNADNHIVMLGNYEGTPEYIVSVLDGIRTKIGAENVEYFKLCEHVTGEINVEEMNALVAAAPTFDAIIFVGGISPQLEGEELPLKVEGFNGGDRTSIELPKQQRMAIQQIACSCKTPLVYVNISGSALALKPESEKCNAMLQAWYGGESGGTAVADVLFGDYNPSGKLPVSFYAEDADLVDYENYTMSDRTYRYFSGKALFPFGHGLSYTKFDYSAAKFKKGALEFTLTNSGQCEGDEIVQVYARREADTEGPIYSLRGFKRVHLVAGESKKVSIPVDLDLFNPETEKMEVTAGNYILYYGGTSDKDKLKSINITL